MIKGIRNKSAKTKNGCALCYNIGAAGRAFCYVTVKWPSMVDLETRTVTIVEKEVPICFVHAKAKSGDNPNGILDPNQGIWLNPFTGVEKVGGGGVPIRDEMYHLVGDNVKLIIGTHGSIPGGPMAPRISKDTVRFEERLRKLALKKAEVALRQMRLSGARELNADMAAVQEQ